jgi:hypothetical protein
LCCGPSRRRSRLLLPLRPFQPRPPGRADALSQARRRPGQWRPAAGRAAAQDYRANRYHQPSDEFDPSWNWTGALHELRIFYAIGRALAEYDDWPNWNEGDEFRAIRDRSRAGQ